MQTTVLDSVSDQLRDFLKSKARGLPHIAKPLVLKLDHKSGGLINIIDGNKKTHSVENKYLESFSADFNNTNYKNIRLHNWEFELKFSNRKCTEIHLNSDYVVLFGAKIDKKEISDCAFKIVLFKEQEINKLPKQIRGYILRIAKKDVVKTSQNVNQEFHELIGFVPRPVQVNAIAKKIMIQQAQEAQANPMTMINAEGKKLLQKLRHYVTREDISAFLVDNELSLAGEKKLRQIANPQSTSAPKVSKKGQKSAK